MNVTSDPPGLAPPDDMPDGGLPRNSSTLLPGPAGSGLAHDILLVRGVRRRSRFWRTISTFKARDSRIDDRTRLFDIGRHGLAIDPSPDRAEAALGEAPGDVLGEPDGGDGPPAGGARPGGAQHWRRRGA